MAGLLALILAVLLALHEERSGVFLVFAHAAVTLTAVALAPRRRPLLAGLAVCVVMELLALGIPLGDRTVTTWLHVVAGAAVIGSLLWACCRANGLVGRCRWLIPITLCGLLITYSITEAQRATWTPPHYDSEACYRFLTASAARQSGQPLFPSALEAKTGPPASCQTGGCHARVHEGWNLGAHATAASSAAYRRTFADFTGRRGAEAGRWCRGCHEPEALAAGTPSTGSGGITCGSCHRAETVHANYGAAALRLRASPQPDDRLTPALRPHVHSTSTFRKELLRSPEFCGACHRKNWNLPQNDYHWMGGPDELVQWQASRYAGGTLFVGDRSEPETCVGCHAPSAGSSSALELYLFARRGAGGRQVELVEHAPVRAGEPLLLDVVVSNFGIGHDFPTGMPDLQESWLEVTVLDQSGRPLLESGRSGPGGAEGPHIYRLVPLDRSGQPIRHGDLDRWARTGEWRRIPAGGSDLARYSLTMPAGGKTVQIRLLRRRRPDFSRWAGEPEPAEPEVLAEVTQTFGSKPKPKEPSFYNYTLFQIPRWRAYGAALAAAKNFPQALGVLALTLEMNDSDVETRLALGRVYLEEGDLLDALEQFRQEQKIGEGPGEATMQFHRPDPERGRAWEGAVLRRMGQPDQAAALLEPLARRYPRDGRLRFELGSAYMAALKNEAAAREFEAVLDVDPTDTRAHFSLMFCLQRLNRLTAARREDTIYKLLQPESDATRGATAATEDRPLHVHTLRKSR